MNNIIKINLYVDSNYTYYINQYLLGGIDGNHFSINWANLKKFIERYVSQKEDTRSVINKNSYFVGIGAPNDTSRQAFYNELECAGIERKSFPLKGNYIRKQQARFKGRCHRHHACFHRCKRFLFRAKRRPLRLHGAVCWRLRLCAISRRAA